jgi:hypothetical protein
MYSPGAVMICVRADAHVDTEKREHSHCGWLVGVVVVACACGCGSGGSLAPHLTISTRRRRIRKTGGGEMFTRFVALGRMHFLGNIFCTGHIKSSLQLNDATDLNLFM